MIPSNGWKVIAGVLTLAALLGWGAWYFGQEDLEAAVERNNRLARADSVKADSIGALKDVARRRALVAESHQQAAEHWRDMADERGDSLVLAREELAAAGAAVATLRDSLDGLTDQVELPSGERVVTIRDSTIREHGAFRFESRVSVPENVNESAAWSLNWSLRLEPQWSVTWTKQVGELVPECRFDMGWPNVEFEDLQCVQNVEPPPIQRRTRSGIKLWNAPSVIEGVIGAGLFVLGLSL